MLGQAKCSNKRTTAELTVSTKALGVRLKELKDGCCFCFLGGWIQPGLPAWHGSSPPLDYNLALTPFFLSLVIHLSGLP